MSDARKLKKLVEKRKKLKEKEAKREAKRKSGKKVFLGNLKTKRNKKKLEKVQKKINVNPVAQKNYRDAQPLSPSPVPNMDPMKNFRKMMVKNMRKKI